MCVWPYAGTVSIDNDSTGIYASWRYERTLTQNGSNVS